MKLTGIELETKRLRLVALSADHVDLILSWANDPAVIANSQFFRDHSDRPRILEFIEHNESDPYSAYFAAFVKPEFDTDGVGYAGNVHLLNINQIHKHCQGGITLRQEAWNHGFAQEVMPALMRWAFDSLNMHKVYLQIFTTNTKGLHLWTKLGFTPGAVLPEHYLVNGVFHDMLTLSFLKGDFDKRFPR